MTIDGDYLSNFRFADDILICPNTPHELKQMNHGRIDSIYVNNTQTENAEKTWDRGKNQDKEIRRRITAELIAFAKHCDIFKGNIGTCLHRQVYNFCVSPAMTYGAETWAATTQTKNKLAVAQTKLNITYRDRNTTILVIEKTKVIDVIGQVRRRKWTWSGHVSRI